ncbi:MAG: MATE family efflux transporter [Lawsonibacter sp.]
MKLENDLGRDPIRQLVLHIAIPSMLAQFVSVLYSIVDRIYIGNIPEVGGIALAGAGVCGPIVSLIASVAFWVGIGGAPLMSIRMGEKNLPAAQRILANCFLMLSVLALLLTGAALAVRRPLLLLFGASQVTLPFALDYYTTYVCGTLFALLSTGMNQFIICQGFAKKGMQSVVLGAGLNLALDPLFIFWLDMGVRGAALATVLSQLGSCLFALWFLFSPVPQVRIVFGGYDRKVMGRVLLTGLPSFVIYAMESMMIIGLNAVLQWYGGTERGDMLVAAGTVAQSFMILITMPMAGITGGTNSILGYNFGAGQPARIREAEKYILALCLVYACVFFLLGQFCPAAFARIFTTEPQVSALAVRAIRLYTLGVIPLAVQYVVSDGFTGIGMMRDALALSMFRKSVYFVALFVLPLAGGAMAVFSAEAVADLFPPMVSAFVYYKRQNWITQQASSRCLPEEQVALPVQPQHPCYQIQL